MEKKYLILFIFSITMILFSPALSSDVEIVVYYGETTTSTSTTSTLTTTPPPVDTEPPQWSNLRHCENGICNSPAVVGGSNPIDLKVDWYDNQNFDTIIFYENSTGNWTENVCSLNPPYECSGEVLIFGTSDSSGMLGILGITGKYAEVLVDIQNMNLLDLAQDLLLLLGILEGPTTFTHTIQPSDLDAGEVVFYSSFANDTSGNPATSLDGSFSVECLGDVNLTLSPNPVEPSSTVTAGYRGVYCWIYVFAEGSCDGVDPCIGGGCAGGSGTDVSCSCDFTSPNIEGSYTYYACADKNFDDDYDDPGESDSEVLIVQTTTTTTTVTTTTTTTIFTTSTTTITAPGPCDLEIESASPPEDTILNDTANATVNVSNTGGFACYALASCNFTLPGGIIETQEEECSSIYSGSSRTLYPGMVVNETGTWNITYCSVYNSTLSDCGDVAPPPQDEVLNVGTFDVYTTTTTTPAATTTPEETPPPSGGGGGGGGGRVTTTTVEKITEEIMLTYSVPEYFKIYQNETGVFNIKVNNEGILPLHNIFITISGISEDSYSISPSRIVTLESGDSTSFSVSVDPQEVNVGMHTLTIKITSDEKSKTTSLTLDVKSYTREEEEKEKICISTGESCASDSDCCSGYCCDNICSDVECVKRIETNIIAAMIIILAVISTIYLIFIKYVKLPPLDIKVPAKASSEKVAAELAKLREISEKLKARGFDTSGGDFELELAENALNRNELDSARSHFHKSIEILKKTVKKK